MKITYIDIGLHKEGKEIEMFLECAKGHDVTVYGIEANPNYIQGLKDRYINFPNVHILNYAIADKDKGEPVKLYLSPSSDGHGNSIYSDKNNVTDDYVEAVGANLSSLINARLTPLSEINILRWNIEGAEWDLLSDLRENYLVDFNCFCGAYSDMNKVGSLKKWEKFYLNEIDRLKWFPFYHTNNKRKYNSMMKRMKDELSRLNK